MSLKHVLYRGVHLLNEHSYFLTIPMCEPSKDAILHFIIFQALRIDESLSSINPNLEPGVGDTELDGTGHVKMLLEDREIKQILHYLHPNMIDYFIKLSDTFKERNKSSRVFDLVPLETLDLDHKLTGKDGNDLFRDHVRDQLKDVIVYPYVDNETYVRNLPKCHHNSNHRVEEVLFDPCRAHPFLEKYKGKKIFDGQFDGPIFLPTAEAPQANEKIPNAKAYQANRKLPNAETHQANAETHQANAEAHQANAAAQQTNIKITGGTYKSRKIKIKKKYTKRY
jgi:hypothetical protein